MKNIKLFTTILLTASTLALTACGNTPPTVSAEETIKNQVVENTTTTESETAVIESVMPETTETAIESEMASEEEIIDPTFNGAGHTETLEETVQSYITYEDIDPVTMYVINNTNGERYSTYHDPNVSEGELYESGLVDANQELLIDGKATYNGVDYYRLAFQPEMMLKHQIIIPADLVVAELQETPVVQPEVQQPVEQQTPPPAVEPQQPSTPEQPQQSAEDIVGKDVYAGLTPEEQAGLEQFLGGGTGGAQIWQGSNNDDPNYNCTVNEKGGLSLSGSGELGGRLNPE